MATRCTIKIEGINYAKVYKHWDGYPDATLKWLTEFNKNFTNNRGDDPNYKFAQLLRNSIRDCSVFDLDPSQYTGWGVVPFDEHWGAEFEYTLHKDGSVTYKSM
jgi:hypothetical protein